MMNLNFTILGQTFTPFNFLYCVFRVLQTEDDLRTGMYKVLEHLRDHEDAWPFHDPVEEEYAPNYYAVIRRPMHISRVSIIWPHECSIFWWLFPGVYTCFAYSWPTFFVASRFTDLHIFRIISGSCSQTFILVLFHTFENYCLMWLGCSFITDLCCVTRERWIAW